MNATYVAQFGIMTYNLYTFLLFAVPEQIIYSVLLSTGNYGMEIDSLLEFFLMITRSPTVQYLNFFYHQNFVFIAI